MQIGGQAHAVAHGDHPVLLDHLARGVWLGGQQQKKGQDQGGHTVRMASLVPERIFPPVVVAETTTGRSVSMFVNYGKIMSRHAVWSRMPCRLAICQAVDMTALLERALEKVGAVVRDEQDAIADLPEGANRKTAEIPQAPLSLNDRSCGESLFQRII
jgi:hypothetical protein